MDAETKHTCAHTQTLDSLCSKAPLASDRFFHLLAPAADKCKLRVQRDSDSCSPLAAVRSKTNPTRPKQPSCSQHSSVNVSFLVFQLHPALARFSSCLLLCLRQAGGCWRGDRARAFGRPASAAGSR